MAADTGAQSFHQGANGARIRLKVRPNEYVSLGDDTIIDVSTLATAINIGRIPVDFLPMSENQVYAAMTHAKRSASNSPVMMTKKFVRSCLLAVRYDDGRLILLDGHKRVFSASFSDPAHPKVFLVAVVEEVRCKPYCNKAAEIGDGKISKFFQPVFKIFLRLLKDNLPPTVAIDAERARRSLHRPPGSYINIIRGQAIDRKRGGVVQSDAEKALYRALLMSIEHCILLHRAMRDPSRVSRAQTGRLDQLGPDKARLTGSIERDFDSIVECALAPAKSDGPSRTSSAKRHAKQMNLSWEHLDRNLRHQFHYVELGFNNRDHMKSRFSLLLSSKTEKEKIDILCLKYHHMIVYIKAIARLRSMQSMYNESAYAESGRAGLRPFIDKFIRFFELKIENTTTAITPDDYIELGSVAGSAGAIAYPEYQLLEGFQSVISYSSHCANFCSDAVDEWQDCITPAGFYFIRGLLDMDNQDRLWPHWERVCRLTGELFHFGNLAPGFDEFQRGKLFFQVLCHDDSRIIRRS